MATLRAAAAVVNLGDDNPVWREAGEPLFPEGLEGQLRATAAILQGEETIAFVTLDSLIVPDRVIAGIIRRVTEATGLTAANLVIIASHTHHAPCSLDIFGCRSHPEFVRRLELGATAALLDAWGQLQDEKTPALDTQAELLLGLSQEATVGRNSRLLLKDGQIGWFGYQESDLVRPTGPYDPDLMVLALRRPRGNYAALLFNHSVHNIGPLEWGRLSPGFYGHSAQRLHREQGAPVVFLPGAFGSTHNITYEGSGVPGPELVERVTGAVTEALTRLRPALNGPLRVLQRPFTYRIREFDEAAADAAVRRYFARYATAQAEAQERCFAAMRAEMRPVMGEERQTTLHVIRLGEVALVGIPGEMFARLGLEIRRRSPFRHTFVIGLANGEIGYLPDWQAYEDGGYQTWPGWHCQVAPGTGEAMVEQALAMLEEVSDAPAAVSPPVLRELRANDGPALQRFYNALGVAGRWLFAPLGWNATRADCETICAQVGQGERYDVVLDDGRGIVGWAFLSRLNTDRAYLGIGLADHCTGQGLGGVLMEAVCAEARRLGKAAIDLIVVQENVRARRLYERFGFVRTGELSTPGGVQFYEMVADLRDNPSGS